jgi:DNA-binding CsgD family transcriptional regulator
MAETLTAAEAAVLDLVGRGLTTKRIARELRIRPATVETHVRSALEKLGARTRVHAAALHRDGNGHGTGTAPAEPLEQCEQELLRLLATGATVGQAASILHVSRRTACRRLLLARAKLGASTTVEAVLAFARGESGAAKTWLVAGWQILGSLLDLSEDPASVILAVPSLL